MNNETTNQAVEEFAQVFAEREEIERHISDAPDILKDILDQALTAADARLAELAEDNAIRDYYSKLGNEVVKAAQALDEITPTLESLGLQEQLDAKRREIDSMAESGHLRAASYFVEMTGVEISPVDEGTADEPPVAPPAQPETNASDKTHLSILIDPNHNLSINGKIISLNRELKVAGRVGAEAEGRSLRVDVLRFLADNPGQEFKASAIWEQIRSGEFDRNLWNLYCQDFFRSEFKIDDAPIVKVNKVHPRLLKYSLGDFDISIGQTDKAFEIADDSIFTLPNGREIGGQTGRFLSMAWRATSENPFTQADVEKLFTPEEWAQMPDQYKRNILSGIASRARLVIKGTDYTLMKVLSNEIDPSSHRRYPAYFMVNADIAGKPGSILAGAEDLTKEERERVIEELSEDLDSPLTLHEATVLAGFLNLHRERLINHGLEAMPVEIFKSLNQKVIDTYQNGDKSASDLKVLRVIAFEKAQRLMSDAPRLEETYTEFAKDDDPRAELLIQLLSYSSEEHLAYIKELLESESEIEVTFDAGRRQGFRIVQIKTARRGTAGQKL